MSIQICEPNAIRAEDQGIEHGFDFETEFLRPENTRMEECPTCGEPAYANGHCFHCGEFFPDEATPIDPLAGLREP